MLSGEYKFYKSGLLVASHKNLITAVGKSHILRYLAGASPQIGDSISVGIGTSEPTLVDKRLDFEVDAQPLDQIGINEAESKLIFKARLNPGITLRITEVGLWVRKSVLSIRGNDSRMLVSADPVTENWIGASWDSSSRISDESLLLAPSAGLMQFAQFSTFNQDLSGYSNSDEFLLAYEAVSNIDEVILRFHTTDQDYYVGRVLGNTNGYHIRGVAKNDFVAVGNPSWGNITHLKVGALATATGPGLLKFDGLRVEKNTNLDAATILISRSKFVVPVIKAAAEPLDIEYTMGFSL